MMTQQQLWELTTFQKARLQNVKSSFLISIGCFLTVCVYVGGWKLLNKFWFNSVSRLLLCMTFCCYSSLVSWFGGFRVLLSLRGQLHSDLPVSFNQSRRSALVLHFQEVQWTQRAALP